MRVFEHLFLIALLFSSICFVLCDGDVSGSAGGAAQATVDVSSLLSSTQQIIKNQQIIQQNQKDILQQSSAHSQSLSDVKSSVSSVSTSTSSILSELSSTASTVSSLNSAVKSFLASNTQTEQNNAQNKKLEELDAKLNKLAQQLDDLLKAQQEANTRAQQAGWSFDFSDLLNSGKQTAFDGAQHLYKFFSRWLLSVSASYPQYLAAASDFFAHFSSNMLAAAQTALKQANLYYQQYLPVIVDILTVQAKVPSQYAQLVGQGVIGLAALIVLLVTLKVLRLVLSIVCCCGKRSNKVSKKKKTQ